MEENVVVFVPQRPQTDRTGTIHPVITVTHSVESHYSVQTRAALDLL